MMKQNWWRSAYKKNHFIFRLGISILLVGFGLGVLISQSSNVIVNVFNDNVPVMAKDVKQISSDFVRFPKLVNEFRPKDKKPERCDVLDGEWIPNSASPPYTNNSCRWIESDQNCMRNGRPDTGYLYWKWSPKACELPRFDAKKFLEMMRDKTWAFVGDSINRNHLQSFLCILCQVEEAIELFCDKDFKNRKWHFPSYNLTVLLVWSPFLAKSEVSECINGVSHSEIKVQTDILDKTWTQQLHTWDYILFSSGKWFIKEAIYYENNTIIGCHGCHGNNITELGFNLPYQKILKKFFNFILNSDHKSLIIYRASTPDHFENGTWSTGGTCDRRVPAKDGQFELDDLVRILRDVELPEFSKAEGEASAKGMKLRLLDVTALSLLRPDGHPGPYRQFYPFANDTNAKVQYDCLHWCLPGPVDYWNDLMMNIVLNG